MDSFKKNGIALAVTLAFWAIVLGEGWARPRGATVSFPPSVLVGGALFSLEDRISRDRRLIRVEDFEIVGRYESARPALAPLEVRPAEAAPEPAPAQMISGRAYAEREVPMARENARRAIQHTGVQATLGVLDAWSADRDSVDRRHTIHESARYAQSEGDRAERLEQNYLERKSRPETARTVDHRNEPYSVHQSDGTARGVNTPPKQTGYDWRPTKDTLRGYGVPVGAAMLLIPLIAFRSRSNGRGVQAVNASTPIPAFEMNRMAALSPSATPEPTAFVSPIQPAWATELPSIKVCKRSVSRLKNKKATKSRKKPKRKYVASRERSSSRARTSPR